MTTRPQNTVLFWDCNASQDEPVTPGQTRTRHQLLMEAIQQFVQKQGSIPAYTFGSSASALQLSAQNFAQIVANKTTPGGKRYIMPAVKHWQQQIPNNDGYRILVAVDGELADQSEFSQWAKTMSPTSRVTILLIGQGDDNKNAVQSYESMVAASNGRVTVQNLRDVTDPATLAGKMLALV